MGGIERVESILDDWKRKIGITDFAIWHADQLRTYLDTDKEVRTAYSGWVLAGDVLSTLLKSLKDTSPDFRSTIVRFLQNELVDQRDTRLQD